MAVPDIFPLILFHRDKYKEPECVNGHQQHLNSKHFYNKKKRKKLLSWWLSVKTWTITASCGSTPEHEPVSAFIRTGLWLCLLSTLLKPIQITVGHKSNKPGRDRLLNADTLWIKGYDAIYHQRHQLRRHVLNVKTRAAPAGHQTNTLCQRGYF